MTNPTGRVYLVGAGPGDAGLLTLRGAECLRLADVVLYDYLASPELLTHVRPGVERICLGRHGHGRLMSQTEINETMVRHAINGRAVVRLKGGDPAIFARVAEELAALNAAGVAYEIVPGVTAAQAASSHASIPLTDRDEASCVAFVTGQERHDRSSAEPNLDFGAGQIPRNARVLHGSNDRASMEPGALDQGKRADTPVAVVRHCSLPDQQTWFTTLDQIGELVRTTKLRPPAVVIVGDVAKERNVSNWFTTRPLVGRTVLITRPEHQSDDLAVRLQNLGANVLRQPAIEIGPPTDWNAVDQAIGRVAEFDWLVFSSSNGVEHYLDRLLSLGHDMRRLANVRLAAIGPGTATALAEFHLKADLQPETCRAESLAEALMPNARGKKILLIRASRGREVLAEMLIGAGAIVEQVVAYESRDIEIADTGIAHALAAGDIDVTTVTSSAIARSLARLFGDDLRKTRLAAISPVTEATLIELGFAPTIVARTYTTEGLVEAILAARSDQV